jgi:serine/threonine protein kinase
VTAKSLSASVDNGEIESAIEKEVNLCHPCIAARIGFVFPTELSGLRELKIVRLFVDGCSLREVVLANPVWWTPTAKAKAVAGIALGLRFVHSLGFVHGNLNSTNIVFDKDHRIQMTHFAEMDLEVQEGDFDIRACVGEFLEERWSGQADVRAFGSLLVEMTVGSPSTLPGSRTSEGTKNQGIAKFFSEMIKSIEFKSYQEVHSLNSIVDILKKNEFQIERGVDSEEVWEFVRWVELCEYSRE